MQENRRLHRGPYAIIELKVEHNCLPLVQSAGSLYFVVIGGDSSPLGVPYDWLEGPSGLSTVTVAIKVLDASSIGRLRRRLVVSAA